MYNNFLFFFHTFPFTPEKITHHHHHNHSLLGDAKYEYEQQQQTTNHKNPSKGLKNHHLPTRS